MASTMKRNKMIPELLSERERKLVDALRSMLALHIAHHNHPAHAAARALLREIEQC